jgi:hypothetical protein
MNTKIQIQRLLVALMTLSAVHRAAAQVTAFTYQGRLIDSGQRANGHYDFQFTLNTTSPTFNDSSANMTSTSDVLVTNGLFTVMLDFGQAFALPVTGVQYWLQTQVRTNTPGGTATFVTLAPHTQITPTPYATYAESAGSAGVFTGPIQNSQLPGGGSITVTAGPGLGGGGPVVPGGAVTLNNSGVLSVSGPADITASTSGGVVTLGSDATASPMANTIVKRDSTGSFSANNTSLGGSLYLPEIVTIYAGGEPVMYADDADNYFAGIATGNLAATGYQNTIVGSGTFELNTSGSDNTACGWAALYNNTTGSTDTAIGAAALFNNTLGLNNTATGDSALFKNTTGSYNAAFGEDALEFLGSGSDNIAIGSGAGINLTGNETDNIDIGNAGVQGDNKTIRIGDDQTTTAIAGIFNGTLGSAGTEVMVDSSGHLGVRVSSAKFKHDIQPMGDVSDVLLKLKPVTFKYNADRDPSGTPEFGLVAEQVNEVDPDLVVRDANHQVYTVRYEAINAMLLNEFLKEHQTVEDLRARLEKMEQIVSEKNAK